MRRPDTRNHHDRTGTLQVPTGGGRVQSRSVRNRGRLGQVHVTNRRGRERERARSDSNIYRSYGLLMSTSRRPLTVKQNANQSPDIHDDGKDADLVSRSARSTPYGKYAQRVSAISY